MSEHDKQPPGSPEEEFKPRAILIFLTIMFVGYVLYWAYVWYVTVIQRGGG